MEACRLSPEFSKVLARYTHRVAISNHRLVAFENDRVSFRWRDYAHGLIRELIRLHEGNPFLT
jgi:hypothetical protein